MTHGRRQIRDAVIAELKAVAPSGYLVTAIIERAVTQTHGGLAKSTLLTSTAKEFDTIVETPVAAISFEYSVIYHTASNDPSTPL